MAGRPKGLPKSGGRLPGSPNRVTVEAKEVATRLLDSEAYRENLRARLESGDLAPAVEAMLWHYAYGKPKETVEVLGEGGGPVRLAIVEVIVDAPDDGNANHSTSPDPAAIPAG